MFCILLWDGQSGVATRGARRGSEKNKVYYTHRSERQEAWYTVQGHIERYQSGQEAGLLSVTRKRFRSQPLLGFPWERQGRAE